jgi:glycosyltransferase involved in cell wall biosynthesis
VKDEDAPGQWAEYGQRVSRGLRHADLVIAPTQSMLAALHEHYDFATPRQVIPNCRDPRRFSPARKQPVIFSAGRLWDEAKNVALLERIAPALDWPVHFAGATRIAPELRQRGGVTMLGALPSSDLAKRLARAAIYAAPARYEPFGLGILEAALSGCALVLSGLPSLRENWEHAAVFVSPDDDAAWVRALNELAAEPERRARLSAAARQRGLQFAPAKTAEAYFRAYQGLLVGRPSQLLETCLT